MRWFLSCVGVFPAVLLAAVACMAADNTNTDGFERFQCIEHEIPERMQKRHLEHWANDVALGDIDGDSKVDALISFSKCLSVWRGDGTGHFQESKWFTCKRTFPVRLMDLEGDDILDAVVGGTIWRNDGKGGLKEAGPVLGYEGRPSLFHDLDNDGDLDAVTGGRLTIHWNDGNGRFSKQVLGDEHQYRGALAVADFDRDGLSDLGVLGNSSGPHVIFNKNGRFDESVSSLLRGDKQIVAYRFDRPSMKNTDDFFNLFVGIGRSPNRIAFADFDGDEDLDLVVTRGCQLDLAYPDYVWMNTGSEKFALSQSLRASASLDLTVADFDRDGDVDMFIAGECGNGNELWINNGAGRFMESVVPFGSNTHGCDVADIDGDKDLDIILVGCDPPRVWINECETNHHSEE